MYNQLQFTNNSNNNNKNLTNLWNQTSTTAIITDSNAANPNATNAGAACPKASARGALPEHVGRGPDTRALAKDVWPRSRRRKRL